MPAGSFAVVTASTPDHFKAFHSLTYQYLQELGEDLSFQDVDGELAALLGEGQQTSCYASPVGAVLLALDATGTPVGAVAVRPLKAANATGTPLAGPVCEMKRLFVVPQHKGKGVGRTLAEHALSAARLLGYRIMVLDTLARLSSANKLYRSLGFQTCQSYYHNPLPQVIFWSRAL